MIKKPWFVATVILVSLCGAYWFGHLGIHGFSIDHSLNPVDLATLAVNIFIAYFLQYYFISRSADDRTEKDILLDIIREALTSTRQCRETLMMCYDAKKISPDRAKSIKTSLRKISNDLESLETALTMSRCSELAEECAMLRNAFFCYKSAATGKNFPSTAYDASSYSEQERTFRDLNQKLHELVFKINQYRI